LEQLIEDHVLPRDQRLQRTRTAAGAIRTLARRHDPWQFLRLERRLVR
jgi:hypothetical protein